MRLRRNSLVLPSLGFWLLLSAIATLAGIVRQLWPIPLIGELRGHQAGTVIVASAFAGAIAVFVRRMRLSPSEALAVGTAWLLGAIIFEFGFGHYVDWNRLLADYDLSEGPSAPAALGGGGCRSVPAGTSSTAAHARLMAA